MLEMTRIRAERNEIIDGLKKRNIDVTETIDDVLEKDQQWRAAKTSMESITSELNKIAKEIGDLFRQGKAAEAETAKTKTAELKQEEAALKTQVDELEQAITELLYQIPNVPNALVKAGKNEEDNETVEEVGTRKPLHEDAVPHWELTKQYNLIDFELGVKVTGAGFPIYRGKGAKLQRALIQFFLDEAEKAGYEEFIVPHVVNEASAYGTGQLPDKEGQMYYIQEDDLYMIPTAEVPLTNIYRDVILPDENFSVKLTGYTPCFRREAGSYGAHVRGLNRLHQFDKVEIVRIEHPDNTEKALAEMIDHVKGLLAKLGLHYRVLRLCGGDTGFASAMTYDFEVYSAAQEKWLEVSSCSRFDTFQANRLKLRFKTADKKNQLVHTLNGSALALPRIMAALMENHQTPEGIEIPECLHKYLSFTRID
ncbi:MAG: serine--tRNA ligase [Candidatus Fluviicola riflensis]|nr:MAG: serine--tRNA ligase [Candidatus Fluviicola riflensis]OGS78438.1 MAG: serine--tRNA ligase [Candidatus Fluviicola riflensis]OGS85504.1 MAG: serine--tRNA ligase [Fluviicola sp. RIFCSPHIGHO2_01_FULL_43_53]OGS87545.1 MAG: serine--tRNA ligase [Fluviicola sp. RIFCSPHIGHO2_12_FULL_43_24]